MSEHPVVALCERVIRSYGVSHETDDAVDAARALLVAWEALECRMLVVLCGEYGKPLCQACEARERILAIVRGEE